MTIEIQAFGDVFDAIAKTPTEAANMKARADLVSAVKGESDGTSSWFSGSIKSVTNGGKRHEGFVL